MLIFLVMLAVGFYLTVATRVVHGGCKAASKGDIPAEHPRSEESLIDLANRVYDRHQGRALLALMTVAIAVMTGCSAVKVGTKAHLDQKTIHAEPKVVFMGDSVTYNYGQSWASTAFAQHPAWIDAGVVGDDSGQMVDRFQTQVVDQRPAVVVILAGTNDTYPGWELCGNEQGPGYNDHNHDTCGNIQYMVYVAKANGIQPILATIPPWGCAEVNCALAEGADGSQARYDRINTLNAWIKSYGAQQGLIVLDHHSALVAIDGNTYVPDLTVDGVHPAPSGYDLITPMVEDAIAATEYK
jgi:lysophospholipase L1-like esterase